MASFVTVIHAARQYKIPCTPAKIMNDVLIEACTKADMDPNIHGLRHGKANLDLSMTVRLAHLPGGAKLDLIKVASNADVRVNVALNLPGTARKTVLVLPTCTLWQVLETFESQVGQSILHTSAPRASHIYRQQTVVQLMNKEYQTDEQLRGTSLASLGIKNGSAVVRVSFRETSDLVTDSTPESAVLAPTLSPSDHVTSLLACPDDVVQGTATKFEPIQPVDTIDDAKISMPGRTKRNVEVLLPSASGAPHYSTSMDREEDLKMSVEQAKAYQASLISRSQHSAPLLTQSYRDQQAADKRLKSKPDTCRVKFRFHDGTQVISSFSPSEVTSELFSFVRDVIEDTSMDFVLERLGDREKITSGEDELWQDLHFGKAVAIQVIGSVEVKAEFKTQGRDATLAVAQSKQSGQSAPLSTIQESKEQTKSSSGSEAENVVKKLPKWLQKSFGKK